MNRFVLTLALALTLFSGLSFAEEANYPNPQAAAPNVYKQVFDNDRVRVSEIKFNPGDKAPMHTHPVPHVVYIIEGGQLTITPLNGSPTVLDAKPGDTLWMGAETHEAVNTGTTVLRATVTEIK